jgi:hypothetical protein
VCLKDLELTAKVVSTARKTGNFAMTDRLIQLLPESCDRLLEQAKLLGRQGKLNDGLRLLWTSSGMSKWNGGQTSSSPVSSLRLIESSEDMKIGLAICEMLRDGRRDQDVASFVAEEGKAFGTLQVESFRETILEQLIQVPAEIQTRDYHDLECHLQYADSVYQRGTMLTKKAENDPMGALSQDLKSRLLSICSGRSELCDTIISTVVPKCLTALVDENRSQNASLVLKRQLEANGIVVASVVVTTQENPFSSGTPNTTSEFTVVQWWSDLIHWLLTPYNRALQAYSRWLFLKSSSPTATSTSTNGIPSSGGSAQPSYVDRTLRATLRLLRLLSKYGDALLMIGECLDAIPAHVWTHVIPQLISRLGHVNFFVRNQVLKLLIKLASSHPHAVMYPALVRSSDSSLASANGDQQQDKAKNNASSNTSKTSAALARQAPIIHQSSNIISASSLSSSPPPSSSSSSAMATRMQREHLARLKHSLIQLHPQLLSDVQLLLTEFERITILLDEKALISVRDMVMDVKSRKRIMEEESTRLQSLLLHPVEKRIVMLKEKHNIVMKPTVMHMEKFVQNISNICRRSNKPSNAASSSSSTTTPTKFESSFASNVIPVIMRCINHLRDAPHFEADGQGHIAVLSLSHAIEELDALYAKLSKSIRRKSFQLSTMSPVLASLSKTSIPVPGYVSSSSEQVTIQSIDETVHILATKTRPKKLRLIGSNGQYFTFMLKGHEDLQLDERIMQILSTVNHLLKRDKTTRKRGEQARHYAVIPTGARSGVIQWVNGTIPLYQLFVDHQMRAQNMHPESSKLSSVVNNHGIYVPGPSDALAGPSSMSNKFVKPIEMFFNKLHGKLNEHGLSGAASRSEWPEQIVREVFDELLRETPNDVFWKEMWCSSSDTEEHMKKIKRYTQSTATMSMIGYVIGLGDRHLDNLLLDASSGEIVHIDYNVCFEGGLRLRVPEVVPFRLTQNMVKAMGVMGLDGTFKISASHVLRVLCSSRETLLTMLEAFVYDPLVDWKSERATAEGDGDAEGDAHEIASRNAETRVALTLFCDRLSILSNSLINPSIVSSTRNDISHMYNSAHLLLNSKTEQAKVSASVKERASQRKSLEANLSQLQTQIESSKRHVDSFKPKLQHAINNEKQAEDLLKAAIATARQEYISFCNQKLHQLLKYELDTSETAAQNLDLYALVLNALPPFLLPSSIPRTLSAFTSTQQWPQLTLTMLHRAKESSAHFDATLSSFDTALQRTKRLLATYRSIANQLTSDYTSLSPVEEWMNALERLIAAPSPEAHAQMQKRLISKYGGLEDFGSSSSSSSNNSANDVSLKEEEELENANAVISTLQSNIESSKDVLNQSKKRYMELQHIEMVRTNEVSSLVANLDHSTSVPPGIVTIHLPEIVRRDTLARMLINLTDDFKQEDAKKHATIQTLAIPANPFLSLFDPLPHANASVTTTFASSTSLFYQHTTSSSLATSLQTVHLFVSRIRLAFALEPSLAFPTPNTQSSLNSSTSSLIEIPAQAEAFLFILHSIVSSIDDVIADFNSVSHMDSNQMMREFINSPALTSPELTPVDRLLRLKNFFATQMSSSHPLMTLDTMLGLSYTRFMTIYTMITDSSTMPGIVEELFTSGHVSLFTLLCTSPQPLPLILSHISSLLYRAFVDFVFDGLALRITRVSQVTALSSQLSPSIISSHQNIVSMLNSIIIATDNSAKATWSSTIEAMQVEKLDKDISHAQNELARIEWCVDHLIDRKQPNRQSMRRTLLQDMEKSAEELASILGKLHSVAGGYGTAEEGVLKLMATKVEQTPDEDELKVHLNEAMRIFRDNCSLRQETVGLLMNVAGEVLMSAESVKRLEWMRTGRVEVRICASEAKSYLDALSFHYEMESKYRELKVKHDHFVQQESVLRSKLNLLGAQMDVDESMNKSFAIELKQAREMVIPATQAVAKYLKFESQVERDLDSLTASISALTRIHGGESSSTTTTKKEVEDPNASSASSSHVVASTDVDADANTTNNASPERSPTSLIAAIHHTSSQLLKVTKYLRTEIRCLTAPLVNYLLAPPQQPKAKPISSSTAPSIVGSASTPSTVSTSTSGSTTTTTTTTITPTATSSATAAPFDPHQLDLQTGQKRFLNAHKLRKRLLIELEMLAQQWMQQTFEEGEADEQVERARDENKNVDSKPDRFARISSSTSSSINVPSISSLPPSAMVTATSYHAPQAASTSLVTTKTINILKRIQQKLEGSDPILFKTLPLQPHQDALSLAAALVAPLTRYSTDDHVQALISEASNKNNLQLMYEGWTAWI